ncbi:hypothetical protein Poli38472_009181 [Pythium oligandrum]|uniref:Conserved oligomeric Golgi complex subunit 6 n=1 Tax=Pythium oligandrum TaxID=41045 RepID=A0A8K1CL13_PYTOL|nr:hypothetical protein Poli38472_009181 [Pythium oligandrum]|eukprot:TMW65014.1 hypothetical protein Poli38472_009181 [Pythium oligandrum]
MTSTALSSHALQARVQKLLGSRAEIESTKALLNTLVTADGALTSTVSDTPSQRAIAAPIVALDANSSVAELRKTLRTSLEEKQLALAESALEGLKQTLDRISSLKENVDKLDSKCSSIQSFLESTKRETQQVQAEAASLAAKKQRVQTELGEIKQFLAKYQLQEDEIQGLYAKSLSDEDMLAFFPIMERVQQVKVDCRSLVASGEIACALELLDTVGKYQEVGFERLYQWTTKKCAEVDGEPSTQLHRAIALLRDRPEFYNFCKESLTSSRRSLIVRRFIMALTRGGPNGIPRPIEMYAHDPVRYCGDMLAWIHQAIATENEFFRVLFDGDLEYTSLSDPTIQNTGVDVNDQSTLSSQSCSMIGRAFEGVARPLQVRIEQTLAAQHGIVIAYKLVHLLAFYHHKFDRLVPHSGIASALATCRDVSNRAFQHQFQVLVDHLAASAQDYSGNLSATHAAMDVSHRLVALLEVFQSSLVAEQEKEADLTPLFESVLSAINRMCERTVQALDPIDAQVFQINNLSCIQVPLARFPEAKQWHTVIGELILQHLTATSEIQAKRLLDRHNVSSILHKIQSIQDGSTPASTPPSQLPGLDGERVSSVMEDFCSVLMTLVFPQFDHLTQPTLREQARTLTVARLAAVYTTIYDFIQDPAHGYHTSHQTSASLGGNQAILLHTPHEVRTALEID